MQSLRQASIKGSIPLRSFAVLRVLCGKAKNETRVAEHAQRCANRDRALVGPVAGLLLPSAAIALVFFQVAAQQPAGSRLRVTSKTAVTRPANKPVSSTALTDVDKLLASGQ